MIVFRFAWFESTKTLVPAPQLRASSPMAPVPQKRSQKTTPPMSSPSMLNTASLIIDEVGYLPLDDAGATILFQLVSARYERGSIILTSNKSYGDWGTVFGDPIIATAVLDRLLHHSTTVNIRGESYRLKDRRKAGLLSSPEQKEEP